MNPRASDLKIAAVASSLRCCQLFGGLAAEDLNVIAAFALLRNHERGE